MNQRCIFSFFAAVGTCLTAFTFNHQEAAFGLSKDAENNQVILIAKKSKANNKCSSEKASYYGSNTQLTAAHRTLPFGTKVKVTNENNGRSTIVTINDRGPFIRCRIIDVSRKAAKELNMIDSGVVPVTIKVLKK
ncbi:septal ring lytic transglycosylase RlpA family protein [Plectonema cf. radiosum LEGE 06105]|uniref:Probable endolytic peptidoglycan transglycosylase RlpA n=1 Tax=Plectonema cf. radiosum LEGE 06105 TaxID=945769 RepID=A0A8J7FNI5_9CYAN|nr:septal ring lytic transglycosylase RlpA family protein [Plectonema radiosum]MBE9216476.1 septal ring lytic transglycosylase RlpA family protein [Plectonema cf. radiosum LEGE 06105]